VDESHGILELVSGLGQRHSGVASTHRLLSDLARVVVIAKSIDECGVITSRARRSPNKSVASDSGCSSRSMWPPPRLFRSSVRSTA